MTTYNAINFGWDNKISNYYWLYTVAPWTGAILAAILHRGHISVFKKLNEKPSQDKLIS